MVDNSKDSGIIANAQMLTRMALQHITGKTFGGKRDMYGVLGYNNTPKFEDYLAKYMRQDVAQRIINALPDAIWTRQPTVQEDQDSQDKTKFEKAFEDLAKRTKLFSYLNRLDRLAGIGHYAVLLLGVRDGNSLDAPMARLSGVEDIMYLAPFSESNATITEYETDTSNERYGLPLKYKLQSGGYSGPGSSQMPTTTLHVHHSRVLHIAEGVLENEVFGTPRLQSLLNRLDDLEKVVGGSAEIFWINGRGGISLNAEKDTDIKDPEKLQEHAENYIHQLTRILRTKGMDVKALELSVHSPEQHVSVILDLISSASGIPKRVLIGSERGQLASSQDEKNWMSRIEERRDNYCEPSMLRPLVDRLMAVGALPEVKEYKVVWPDLVSPSEVDKAEIALKLANAVSAYVNSNGAELVIPTEQFVEDVLGMEYRESDIGSALDEERRQMQEDQAEIERQQAKEAKNGNSVSG